MVTLTFNVTRGIPRRNTIHEQKLNNNTFLFIAEAKKDSLESESFLVFILTFLLRSAGFVVCDSLNHFAIVL